MPPEIELIKSQSDWSLQIKLKRALWSLCQPAFFILTPRLFSPLRVLLLRLFGAKLGRRVLIMGGVKVWMPWNLTIDDYTAIGKNVEIYNFAEISIGANTVISQYTYLCSATHDYTHPHMTLTWFPITIGRYCWLAADTFVAPGVTIGEGSVVGARSVVTRSLPEWSVCAGNPCRVLKPRIMKPL